jgi:EAL domain-containing protein (putative c-di-GMP-specific phosphodiesterase class I)/FixJ family two-component response regulator
MNASRSHLNIAIVDDDPFALRLLARQLSKLGLESVAIFQDGHEGLAHVRASNPPVDLIFCDLDMPEMDGVEFVRHLVRPRYDGGLVLVSGADRRILETATGLARAHGLRVLGALAKPVSLADLEQVLDPQSVASPSLARARRRTYDSDELRRAIEHDDLYCDFQPLVEVATGRVVGVEALVRWCHETDGILYPDQFVGTAEACGLMESLTAAVMRRAFQQCRSWQDDGLNLNVSVNVSVEDLASLRFPDMVMEKIAEAGLDVSSVTLEVTESQLMKDRLSALDVLTRLRLKNLGLSIDDFGTGHSSLAQLRDVPFDELKVDRSFVRGAGQDVSLRAICTASIDMANQLGMRTVAEGVEDAEDWKFLQSAGVDLAQGYFIARPMPPQNLEAWMSIWERRVAAPGDD